MNTRTITGTIVRPSGAAWSAATLTFKLRARFVVDADTVLPDRVTATTDEDGAFSVALAVPDTGTASYEFTAPVGGSAVFYLEAGAPIELAVLLSARGVSVSPDAVAVEAGLRAAADAALQAQIDAGGGGGGAVASVNGQTGVVVLDATDVGADASGTAAGLVASEAATRAAADTTNATALSTHVADTANPHAVTAAQVGAYTSGAVDTLLAAKQPLDSDLTAIAALTTATYGRALLALADAAALRTAAALGTAATANSTDFVAAASVTGGGVLATGGFTLTVPSTGTAALLGTANSFTAAQSIGVTDASAGSVPTVATFGHNTSNTPSGSNAFGSRLIFNLQTSTTADVNAGAIEHVWNNPTHASRSSEIRLYTATTSGFTEALRLSNLGIIAIAGNTSAVVQRSAVGGVANGSAYTIYNLGTATGTNITMRGSNTIATGQYIRFGFGSGDNEVARVASEGVSASTSAIVDTFVLRRNPSSGTPATGTGHQIRMAGKSDTTADRDLLSLSAEWATATDASRKARIKLQVYDTAAREVLRGEASGSAPMIGFLGASAVGVQSVGAAATDAASTQTLANNLRTALINLGLATT